MFVTPPLPTDRLSYTVLRPGGKVKNCQRLTLDVPEGVTSIITGVEYVPAFARSDFLPDYRALPVVSREGGPISPNETITPLE
jgi:hypothetical protein